MQPIGVPKFPRLRGEKAIKALYDFINELEEQRGKELTEKQTTALIKFAKGLIFSIKVETLSGSSDKEKRFATQLKRTIMKHIPESFQTHEDGKLWKLK